MYGGCRGVVFTT